MASSNERANMNPISATLDRLGFPQPDQIFPMPADVAGAVGLPTPEKVFGNIADKVTTKIGSRGL